MGAWGVLRQRARNRDCCAMPEVCGDAAILSPVDDVDALARNLEIALTDTAKVHHLRDRGAARVHVFRWNETADSMAEAMEKMAGR